MGNAKSASFSLAFSSMRSADEPMFNGGIAVCLEDWQAAGPNIRRWYKMLSRPLFLLFIWEESGLMRSSDHRFAGQIEYTTKYFLMSAELSIHQEFGGPEMNRMIKKYGRIALIASIALVLFLMTGCQIGNRKSIQEPAPNVVSMQQQNAEGQLKQKRNYLVYLSPSKQFDNDYVIEGTEGKYMYLIAEAIIPYLKASNVDYILADKEDDLYTRTEIANEADCDLYLSIHSNGFDGQRRGTIIFYQKDNEESQRFAETIAENFREISLTPTRVFTQFDPWIEGENGYIETREPNCMSALIEVAYHDNLEDANWIKDHVEEIAANLAESITKSLGVTFVRP